MKIFSNLILSAGVLFSGIAYADNLHFKMQSVIVDLDQSTREVSTEIKFTNTGKAISNWQLGFCYLQNQLITFAKTNPHLTMQICNTKNKCVNLVYQKAATIRDNDLSAGYTTILQPQTRFPLNQRETYTVKISRSKHGVPRNYSNMPQNFFIFDRDSKKFIAISTMKKQYVLNYYHQDLIDAQIKEHVENNWNEKTNHAASTNSIVPTPVSYVAGEGAYALKKNLRIHTTLPNDSVVPFFFTANLARDLKINAVVDYDKNANNDIIIKKIINPNLIKQNPEGYQIQITHQNIVISVLNDTGEFYALQTLRQLWNQNRSLPIVTIIDYPRFKYRGLMLDVARHFFSIAEIKKFIDLMAAHKLNSLHLHFADDEGFRLILEDFPTLKTIGASRGYGKKIAPLLFLQGNLDKTNIKQREYPAANALYSHAYSKSDIRELINYANARKITLIPEIDIPGHARALIKSLPQSFLNPDDHSEFVSVQGYSDNVLPVCTYQTNEKFTRDLNHIMQQIAALFDHQNTLYALHNEISVSGDEVSPGAWKNDKSCQGEWQNLSALAKTHKFFHEISNHNPNILFSGWQQLVQSNGTSLGETIIPAEKTGHVWVWNSAKEGAEQAATLAQNNYPTVLAFSDKTYFDLTYTPDIDEPGFTWATHFSDTHAALSSAVSASETLDKVKSLDQKNKILGLEGELWSEVLASYDHLTYMAIPKMAGLAEASWSPAGVIDWRNLTKRLGCGSTGFLKFLQRRYDVYYRGYPYGIYLEVPKDVCQLPPLKKGGA